MYPSHLIPDSSPCYQLTILRSRYANTRLTSVSIPTNFTSPRSFQITIEAVDSIRLPKCIDIGIPATSLRPLCLFAKCLLSRVSPYTPTPTPVFYLTNRAQYTSSRKTAWHSWTILPIFSRTSALRYLPDASTNLETV